MASLSIKNPKAHRLATAMAKETGETLTRAVIEALRERFERLSSRQKKAGLEELCAIAKRAVASRERQYQDHADFLDDEQGLPK
jgi:antitoxin VapB